MTNPNSSIRQTPLKYMFLLSGVVHRPYFEANRIQYGKDAICGIRALTLQKTFSLSLFSSRTVFFSNIHWSSRLAFHVQLFGICFFDLSLFQR